MPAGAAAAALAPGYWSRKGRPAVGAGMAGRQRVGRAQGHKADATLAADRAADADRADRRQGGSRPGLGRMDGPDNGYGLGKYGQDSGYCLDRPVRMDRCTCR